MGIFDTALISDPNMKSSASNCVAFFNANMKYKSTIYSENADLWNKCLFLFLIYIIYEYYYDDPFYIIKKIITAKEDAT